MIDEAVERIIEDYLRSIRKVLPDSFETDDLVDDLRSHIIESYQHKTEQKPDTGRIALIGDVLDVRLGNLRR
jgi:hypothetical protein